SMPASENFSRIVLFELVCERAIRTHHLVAKFPCKCYVSVDTFPGCVELNTEFEIRNRITKHYLVAFIDSSIVVLINESDIARAKAVVIVKMHRIAFRTDIGVNFCLILQNACSLITVEEAY